MGRPINPDVIAAAVVAAAASYGDDPVRAMTSRSPPLRRSLTATAAALHDTLRLRLDAAAAVFGLSENAVYARIRYGDASFQTARQAAAVVLSARLGVPTPVAAPVPPPKPNMPSPAVIHRDAPLPQGPEFKPLSPSRATARVGKPAQAKADARIAAHGRHPADEAGDGYEARFVMERRARGIPWRHIATQLGTRKTADDLRRIYDPGFDRAAVVSVADAARVSDAPKAPVGPASALTPQQARVLSLIGGGQRSVASIAELVGIKPSSLSTMLGLLRRKGLACTNGDCRWAPTDAGRQQLEALRG